MSEDSINRVLLSELQVLMEDDFSLLLETYIADCDQRIEQLAKAIQDTDHQAIRELAHALKGSSSNLGAEALAETCYELEQMGRDNNLTNVQITVDTINTQYTQVKSYLTTLI